MQYIHKNESDVTNYQTVMFISCHVSHHRYHHFISRRTTLRKASEQCNGTGQQGTRRTASKAALGK